MAGVRIFAHRGFAGRAPENTLAAFTAALRVGVDGLECDVQLSRDGEIMICHDERLSRTTNGRGWLKDFDFTDLRRLDAGAWFGPEFRGERLPALAELLELVQGTGLLVNVELKTGVCEYPGLEAKVVGLIRRYRLTGQSLISSFNPASLRRVKSLAPEFQTGALYTHPAGIDDFWGYAAALEVSALHPLHQSVTPEFVTEARARGLQVNAWTVDEPAEAARLRAAGVNGLITNFPDRIAGTRRDV
jgi:glycerophosphoryl diester phosphodiesterase